MMNNFFSPSTVFRKFPRTLLLNSFTVYTVGLISRFKIFWADASFSTTVLKSTLPTNILLSVTYNGGGGGSEYSAILKTGNLLIFRDAQNAENTKSAPNWNGSGTRDFSFARQNPGIANTATILVKCYNTYKSYIFRRSP
jgi:hypothetical protein